MALVGGMMLPRRLNPVGGIIFREEDVSFYDRVYLRKVHALGDPKRLAEDSRTSDNENFLLIALCGYGKCAVNGMNNLATRRLVITLVGYNDIRSVGQWSEFLGN